MKRNTSGFTIVELLIVIVVIGILAAITLVSFNGIQQRARDSDRVSDINTISKKLEVFYALNNYYPSSSDMTNQAFRQSKLDLVETAVIAPNGGGAINYCWDARIDQYCYVAHPASGVSGDCTLNNAQCAAYTLRYNLESSPATTLSKLSSVAR